MSDQRGLLPPGAIGIITSAVGCGASDVSDVQLLKKGMTNRSFLFTAAGRKYILRVPGEGTRRLINRAGEVAAYRAIAGRGLCDAPVYLNPDNGYKITAFLADVRTCDPNSDRDVARCMDMLRDFHRMRLTVPHTFDLFAKISFYEELWDGRPSAYSDYRDTKAEVFALRRFLEAMPGEKCLSHIDAVCDNFLFYRPEGRLEEALQLSDWEYAGMQDPHVDIAMFAIYSDYDKPRVDWLIDLYFRGDPGRRVRSKIYCYVAACGLLWSNWTEYKRIQGVEFGEYGPRQYAYAKEYCRHAAEAFR